LGIRVALGAQRGDILRSVLGRGAQLIGTGAVAGICASLWLTSFLSTQLYAVGARNPFVLTAAVILLAVVSFLACCIPARRALQIDAITTLRDE
jgi:ABC-type antimicrobial peptide transport system permease subunit